VNCDINEQSLIVNNNRKLLLVLYKQDFPALKKVETAHNVTVGFTTLVSVLVQWQIQP
jgi:hypothetical protein